MILVENLSILLMQSYSRFFKNSLDFKYAKMVHVHRRVNVGTWELTRNQLLLP